MKNSFMNMINTIRYSYSISLKASIVCTYLRILITLCQSVLPVISLNISKEIINTLCISLDKNTFIRLLLFSTILALGSSLFGNLNTYLAIIHNEKIAYIISIEKYAKSIEIDTEYYDSSQYYNKFTDASKNSGCVHSVIWNVINFVGCIVKLFSIGIILTKYSLIWTILLIVASIPCGLIEIYHKTTMLKLQRKLIPYERKLGYTGSLFTNKSSVVDIKLYRCFEYIKQKFDDLWEIRFCEVKKHNRNYSISSYIIALLPQIVILIIGINIGFTVLDNNMNIGEYTYYTGCSVQLLNGVKTLIGLFAQMKDNTDKVQSYIDYLNWENKIVNSGKKVLDKKVIHEVEVRDLSFKYPGTQNFIIQKLNLSFKTNERIAIVGINGAGKSTLVKLLLRLYEPDSGEILIDGININEYRVESIYDYFSVMLQDYNRYSFTLRENIALSDYKKINDEDKLICSIKKADAYNVYEKLGSNLDAYLTRVFDEEGRELSGGEWQKVALTRCFFKDKGMIILDEPSSSLDAKAENEIFLSTVQNNDIGIVLITHRLSNIRYVEKIFVINDAGVAESGTHEELMSRQGIYYNMYTLQKNKYL